MHHVLRCSPYFRLQAKIDIYRQPYRSPFSTSVKYAFWRKIFVYVHLANVTELSWKQWVLAALVILFVSLTCSFAKWCVLRISSFVFTTFFLFFFWKLMNFKPLTHASSCRSKQVLRFLVQLRQKDFSWSKAFNSMLYLKLYKLFRDWSFSSNPLISFGTASVFLSVFTFLGNIWRIF